MIMWIEASNILALQKSSKHMKICFLLANNIYFMKKDNIFYYLSFTLKIALSNFLSLRNKLFSIRGHIKLHFATFSHWERSFSVSVALHSLNLLSCTKQSISVLRSSKLVILCIEALIWLALQKRSNTWKSVFCIANNI